MSYKFVEEKHANGFSVKYDVERQLFSGQSDFQKVEVVETKGFGKMLLNDDLVMVTEKDEFVYHDMIVHVPLFLHPHPESVLVIGGGDGGTAREVLRHSSIKKCTMVEIDKLVVDVCKEFIPLTSSQLEHPKLELIIDDGVRFMKESQEKFDVILVDSTDPIGPATPLFGDEFYQDVSSRLTDNGIVVSQGESPWYEVAMQKKLLSIVKNFFPISTVYNFSNITYPGGLWSFVFASKGIHPLNDFHPERVTESKMDFQYYNTGIHKACFSLPEFELKNLREFIQI